MLCAILAALAIAPPTVTFDPVQGSIKTSRDLYGIFFEEINCAGDGGIYPELVRNRSFEEGLAHWEVSDPSRVKVVEQGVGKHFLQVTLGAPITLKNKGYWGMHFDPSQKYCLTTRTGLEGTVKADVKFYINGKEVGGREWGTLDDSQSLMTKKGTLPSMSASNASMELTLTGTGKVFFDFISVAPHDKELQPERFRPDLKKMLADLKPRFMRFPGGCWVEGDTMKTAYRWKTTIGDPLDRAHVSNLWGYQSTNGLGYHEYLQLCEDLNAAPMFVVNCGMSHKEVVPMDKMDEFVQDALDAIEYANGASTSKWGAIRAANGHPGSFKLKYLEIGNENGGAAYEERYDLIYKAVKAKYPEIHLIANVWGGTPKKAKLDIIDEHYYSNPSFFIENADRYDTYDRKGPKVYVGEYAVTQGCGNGNLIAAIAEAAFMIGMERNSDHVIMASYAPLLANLNLKSWNPDLIYFDSSKAYGTPSYHVQKMFAENLPDEVFKSAAIGLPSIPTFFPKGGIGVGTWNTQAEFKDIAIYNGKGIRKIAPQEMAQESGVWTVADEVAKQTGNATPTRLFAPISEASYTVKLKARRLSGAEGFLITVGRKDKDNYLWLNLGGWGNSQHAIEWAVDGGKRLVGKAVPGKIETGTWYDISIEYSESRIRCFLDGRVIFDEKPKPIQPLVVTTGKSGNELITKVANVSNKAVAVNFAIGAYDFVRGQLLTSDSPLDENSLLNPNKVVPKPIVAKVEGKIAIGKFPPYSLTIWRFRKR